MVNQLLQLLGSYDFFGKAVPGAALLFGLWLFLPKSVLKFQTSSSSPRLGNIVVLLALLLVLGLMIGQGVHTLAQNTEKAFKWLLTMAIHGQQFLKLHKIDASLERFEPEGSRDNETGVDEIKYDWHMGAVEWTRNRSWGIYDTFIDHRRLFTDWFVWNFAQSDVIGFDDRWERGKKDAIMDPFCDAFEATFGYDMFDADIRQAYPDELNTAYPLVLSHLSQHGVDDHRQFQAIYSFCRSMWVVLLVLGIVSILAVFQPFGNLGLLDEPSRIENTLPRPFYQSVPALLMFSAAIFMDAAGTYKRHFVEYVFASFATLVWDDPPEQLDLNRFR